MAGTLRQCCVLSRAQVEGVERWKSQMLSFVIDSPNITHLFIDMCTNTFFPYMNSFSIDSFTYVLMEKLDGKIWRHANFAGQLGNWVYPC